MGAGHEHEDHSGSDGAARGHERGAGNRAAAGARSAAATSRASRCGSASASSSRSIRPARIPLESYRQESQEEAAQARKLFELFMQQRGVPQSSGAAGGLSCGWLDDAPEGESFVGSYGRVFDITVLSRPDANTIGLHNRAIESGLFESGRPILLSPPVPPKDIATNVMVHWNCSTEQARATAFAMPLLHAGAARHGADRVGRAGGAGADRRAIAQASAAQRHRGEADDGRARGQATPAKRSCARRRRKAATSWSRAPSPRAGCGR